MAVTKSVDWRGCEDALHDWIAASCGIPGSDVRVQARRDQGPARAAPPKALIRLLSISALSQQMSERWPQIMQGRVTVIADGPGEVGIDFFSGTSTTAQRISVVADAGDPPATSAAALLGELQANLPAGYTAGADPNDDASILLEASAGSPMFAHAPADADLVTATTPVPRFPEFVAIQHLVVWRIEFRAAEVAGPDFAADMMASAKLYRATLADPRMRALGFRTAGWRGAVPSVPDDRAESLAVLDAAWIGLFTGAVAKQALRQAAATSNLQLAS